MRLVPAFGVTAMCEFVPGRFDKEKDLRLFHGSSFSALRPSPGN